MADTIDYRGGKLSASCDPDHFCFALWATDQVHVALSAISDGVPPELAESALKALLPTIISNAGSI